MPLKYYFFTKYKFYTYPPIFYKISTLSLIKDKKMKEDKRNINIYIKIMYIKALLFSYTLSSTVAFPMFRKSIGKLL
jgi:hypothetical protein